MKKTFALIGTTEDGFDLSFTIDEGGKWEKILHLKNLDEAEAICTVLNALTENEKVTNLIISIAKKSQQWDYLDADIAKFYPDGEEDEDVEGDLGSIGEIAAIRLGYL